VLFADPSNTVGQAKATTGRKPVNENGFDGFNGAEDDCWRCAELGYRPLNDKSCAPSNIALHFVDRLQRATGSPDYLIGTLVNCMAAFSILSHRTQNVWRMATQI